MREEPAVEKGNSGSRTKSMDTSPKAREAQGNDRGKVCLVALEAGHSSAGSTITKVNKETQSGFLCSTSQSWCRGCAVETGVRAHSRIQEVRGWGDLEERSSTGHGMTKG